MEKNHKGETEIEKRSSKKIKIYTTKTCPWCIKTKAFLEEHGVEYEEAFVDTDTKSRNEMLRKSGQLGVPVVDVNGTIIVGFEKDALKRALGI